MAINKTPIDQTTYSLRLTDIADEPRRLLLPIEGFDEMPLVSLEKTIEPIRHLFPEIHKKVYVANENCKILNGPLTQDAAASIMLYTMGKLANDQALYYILNSILRSDQPDRADRLKPWFLYLKLFITGLSYIPSYRGTIYRGVKLDLSDYYTVDKIFVWWGFSSCTKNLSVLQSELFLGQEGVGTLFIIDCFSGKEIRDYSYFEKEDEVLLVAARQFIVIGRLNPKPQLWIIQIKEIEPPFPFLKVDSSISSTLERSITNETPDTTSSMICSECSKKFSNVSIIDSMTHSDNSPSNVESNNNNDKTNQSINIDGTSIPTLTNSLAPTGASNSNTPSPSASLITPSNLDELASVEVNKDSKQVKTMFFKSKTITEKTAQTIAEDIRRNTVLEILYFCKNNLNDNAFGHVIQAIINRTGLKLFINDNSITDVSAATVADILTKAPNAIVQLHLEKNQLTNQGIKIIVQALTTVEKSGLKALGFTGNQLIDDGCIDDIIHLCKHNQQLKSLYLDRCNLSIEGKERLRKGLIEKKALFLQL